MLRGHLLLLLWSWRQVFILKRIVALLVMVWVVSWPFVSFCLFSLIEKTARPLFLLNELFEGPFLLEEYLLFNMDEGPNKVSVIALVHKERLFAFLTLNYFKL